MSLNQSIYNKCAENKVGFYSNYIIKTQHMLGTNVCLYYYSEVSLNPNKIRHFRLVSFLISENNFFIRFC